MLGMIGALALIWVGFHLYTIIIDGEGLFLTPRNLWNLLVQTSSVAVMATGMVLVIVMRHIDLSVGSILGFTSTIIGVTQVYFLPHYLGLDNPAIWIITRHPRPRRRRGDRRAARIAGRLSRHSRFHRHARRPIVLARRGMVGHHRRDDRPARRAFRADGRRPARLDRRRWRAGPWPALACVGIMAGLYAGRRRRVRYNFPLRPMWAEVDARGDRLLRRTWRDMGGQRLSVARTRRRELRDSP